MRRKLTTALVITFITALAFSAIAWGCLCPQSPTVISIDPNTGMNTGEIATKITGTKFNKKAIVRLVKAGQADIVGTGVKVNSPTSIDATFDLKGTAVGPWDVVVENPYKKVGTLVNGFTIKQPLPAPKITAILPNQGDDDETVSPIITGANFVKGAKVKLTKAGSPDIAGTDVNVVSAANLSALFDLTKKPLGVYDVVVTNPDGQFAVLKNGFTINKYMATVAPTPEPSKAPNIKDLLKPIYFNFDKADIRPDQMLVLKKDLDLLKDYLAQNPKAYVVLAGHTDERGSNEYNIDLALRRSDNIKKYLVENGIDASRIIVYTYGEDVPANKGHDEAAWSLNRRVEVTIWESMPTRDEIVKPQ